MSKQKVVFRLKEQNERRDLELMIRDITDLQRRFTGAQAILAAELRGLAQKYNVAPAEGLSFDFDQMAFVVTEKAA